MSKLFLQVRISISYSILIVAACWACYQILDDLRTFPFSFLAYLLLAVYGAFGLWKFGVLSKSSRKKFKQHKYVTLTTNVYFTPMVCADMYVLSGFNCLIAYVHLIYPGLIIYYVTNAKKWKPNNNLTDTSHVISFLSMFVVTFFGSNMYGTCASLMSGLAVCLVRSGAGKKISGFIPSQDSKNYLLIIFIYLSLHSLLDMDEKWYRRPTIRARVFNFSHWLCDVCDLCFAPLIHTVYKSLRRPSRHEQEYMEDF